MYIIPYLVYLTDSLSLNVQREIFQLYSGWEQTDQQYRNTI